MSPTPLRLRLKRLFLEAFTALDVAEPLPSFDADQDADRIRRIAEQLEMPAIGVRVAGCVAGYVLREQLTAGRLVDHMHSFAPGQLLSDDASLAEVIAALEREPWCFVRVLGQVSARIGRGDIQKPPVRMWLFGMITIVEMRVGEQLETLYPGHGWREQVAPGRLRKAEQLQAERRRRGQEVALLDCLQLADKFQLLIKLPERRAEMGFQSLKQARRAVKEFESLRNNLAHAQDIVSHDWEAIVGVAGRLDRILERIR